MNLITWHFYDLSTGMFIGRTFSAADDRCLAQNIRDGEGAISGVDDPGSQKVESGVLVDYQPPAPDADHEWIHDDEHGNRVRRWVLKPEAAQRREAKAAALARIAELERKEPRARREHDQGIQPSEADRAAGAMTLQEIWDEIAQLRAVISGETGTSAPEG